MPSLSAQKVIRKLRQRKYRWQEERFVAEGPKLVEDLIQSGLQPEQVWSTQAIDGAEEISEELLAKLSHLSTPNQVLAIFPFPKFKAQEQDPILILDGINDPGNLGTLLRTADWFGFKRVICTTGTADIYNAKAVQSTMGSLARLEIQYLSVDGILSQFPNHRYLVAEMEGQDFKSIANTEKPIALVMGSESHGPDAQWQNQAEYITIPRPTSSGIDSLNVGIAAGILMNEFSATKV